MAKPKKPVSLADLFALSGSGQTGGREQLAMPSLALDMPATLPEPAVPAVNQANIAQVAETQDALASPLTFQDPFAGSSMSAMTAGLQAQPKNPKTFSWESKLEDLKKEQTKNSLTENRYLSPEEYARLEEQAMGVNPDTGAVNANSPYQLQKKGINDTNEMLRVYAENSPVQTDLSPLAALVDQWTGSKLAPSYKTPTPYSEVFKSVLGAQKGLQDDRASMAKEIQGAIRGMKSGFSTDALTSEALARALLTQGQGLERTAQPRAGRDPSSKFAQALTLVKGSPEFKDLSTEVRGAASLLTAAKGKSWVNDRMMIANLAKSAGLYPLSDRDVAGFSGDPSIWESTQRVIGKLANGEPFTEKDRKDILTFAEAATKVKGSAFEQMRAEAADTLSGPMGIDRDQLFSALGTYTNVGPNMRKAGEKSAPAKAAPVEKPAEKKITVFKDGKTYKVSPTDYAKWTPAQKAQYRSK